MDKPSVVNLTCVKGLKFAVQDGKLGGDNGSFYPSSWLTKPLIDDDSMIYINTVIYLSLLVVSICGVAANVVTICVFIKQGFQEHLNISLTALAISDLLTLLALVGTSFCILLNGFLPKFYIDFFNIDLRIMMWIRECFYGISSLITVHITVERCLMVVLPFTFRGIASHKKTIVITIIIYLSVSAAYVQMFRYQNFQWVYDPCLGITRFTFVHFEEHWKAGEILSYFGMVLLIGSQTTVVVATIIMVRGLNASSKFRKVVSNSGELQESSGSGSRSTTDKMLTLVKVVELVAIVFVISNLPAITSTIIFNVIPPGSPYLSNLMLMIYSLARLSGAVNASCNIIIYYKLSTSFRASLKRLLDRSKSGPATKSGQEEFP